MVAHEGALFCTQAKMKLKSSMHDIRSCSNVMYERTIKSHYRKKLWFRFDNLKVWPTVVIEFNVFNDNPFE